MEEAIKVQKVGGDIKTYLDKYNLNYCLTCGSCSSTCPVSDTPGMEGWDPRKALRMLALGLVQEVVDSKFPWVCTGCGKCVHNCPMDIDIPYIMLHMKSLRPRDDVPGIVHKGAQGNFDVGNNMSIPQSDYLFLLADVGNELAEEECPGFYVPLDKDNADIYMLVNSKEVFGDDADLKWWWKIFYAAKENWTSPLENWESVDWGLFTGNYEFIKVFAQRKMDFMKKHKVKRMIMPDCGGGSYGCRVGMSWCKRDEPTCKLDGSPNEVPYVYLYKYLEELLKSGRIKVKKQENSKLHTFHDSCKHGRELARHFNGESYYEEPRWIIQQCVDNYVDMYPNRENTNCCGAGGGMWPGPYEEESAWHGKFKYESIKNCGAEVVVVGCSNCRDQLMRRIPKFYTDHKYEVKYIWQLIADSLEIEPWTAEEIAKGEAKGKAQWEKLGVDLDQEW
ncbi:MAG: Fe-S oxidoreductase [Desulfobacterales bacterium C00003060]|nr:MAG: Fe-S oxidoreductase [Desulfobacterales bacterium S3730MH5]OEU77056.1 MAG: Fe-S oxidoreductase [Desulfobacterales bacterium C00003060]